LHLKLLPAAPVAALAGSLFFASAAPAEARSVPSVPVIRTTSTVGYDISYPQCAASYPRGASFGIVGVTNGKPWSVNGCLASEFAWATALPRTPGFYMNTANPGPISGHWTQPGPATCVDPKSTSDTGCAYNYGWNSAANAFGYASAASSATSASAANWWLDVETGNSWNGTLAANTADLQGSVDFLRRQHVAQVGVYSTPQQWGVITGSYRFSGTTAVPSWVAGASTQRQAAGMCTSAYAFTGSPVQLSQYLSSGYDADYRC
jgi:hypothetical protein